MTDKPFIGRSQELEGLEETAKRPGAKLIVIKGRRRVGKSRLARELGRRLPDTVTYHLTGLPPHQVPSARENLEEFARQISRVFGVPLPAATDWDDLLWHVSDRVKGGNAILILNEINWLGMDDPRFSAKLWRLWETELSLLPNFILILSGSLTGWIDNQFSSNTGYLGRISWNLTLDELPVREALRFFGARGARLSLSERLTILMVTGGIPRYLEEIDPRQTAEQNLRRLCFSPQGLLFSEYDHLLNDLFPKKNKSYRGIIEALVERPLMLGELRKVLGKQKSGVLSASVEELEKAGFLMRHHTWNPRKPKPSNQYKVRISDNYLRFHHQAIGPNHAAILSGADPSTRNLAEILGLQFENLVIRNRGLLWAALNIEPGRIVRAGPYFQKSTKKHRSCQIDYLIQTRDTLYVVEIRLTGRQLGIEILDQVQDRIDCLIKPKHKSIRPVLVHLNGVTESLESKDFFDSIIDYGALVGGSKGLTRPGALDAKESLV